MNKAVYILSFLVSAYRSHAADKPNILLIAVDDLYPELGCYGSNMAITPNLASRFTVQFDAGWKGSLPESSKQNSN
jgi:hypothetical protein